MKRLALVILLSFPALKYASAQTFEAGFYGGATMTDIPGTDNIDNDDDFEHLGFTIAGTVATRISPSTKLQMEIRYFVRGAEQTPAILNDSASTINVNPTGQYLSPYFTLTLRYVDVALGIKHAVHFNLRNKATDRYGIETGVSLGALVSYSYEAESINYTLDLNKIDISPYVGIYYNITPHFYVEGRYSNSIFPVVKQDGSNSQYFLYYGSWNDGHNIAFSLTMGFNFGGSASFIKDTPPVKTDADDN